MHDTMHDTMHTATYVIPAYGLGATRDVPVRDVDSGVLSWYLKAADRDAEQAGGRRAARNTPADASIELDVTLSRGENTPGGGYDVLLEQVVIGTIGGAEAKEYQELGMLIDAGLTPQATAHASLSPSGGATVTLRLPRPGLVVPDNQPPAQPWVLLDSGRPYAVVPAGAGTDTQASAGHTGHAGHAGQAGRRHVLVTLDLDGANARGQMRVVARVDGEVVGHLEASASEMLEPTLTFLARRGLIAVARGYQAQVAGQPTLTVNAGELDVTRRRSRHAHPGDFPDISPIPPATFHAGPTPQTGAGWASFGQVVSVPGAGGRR